MSQIYYKQSPYRQEAGVSNQQGANVRVASKELVKFNLSPMLIIWMLALMCVLLGIGFLASYNKVATKGYYLKRLELAKQELIDQKERVDLEISKAKSLTIMLADEKLQGFQKANKIQFISIEDSFIAQNK